MPAYNFSVQFAPLVESGKKRQTIRRVRKRPTVPGDTLYLYTGMRTKACRQLSCSPTMCSTVSPFVLRAPHDWVLDGVQMIAWERTLLALNDGFETPHELEAWFTARYGLPFAGQVVCWEFTW